MKYQVLIKDVWQYSHYFGDLLFTSKRLYESEEYYASVWILFNTAELIFKSIRRNYKDNFNQDIEYLKNQGFLDLEEYDFLDNKKTGLREIRNIMAHRDAYQFCFDDDSGIIYPFSESDTWKLIFESFFQELLIIIHNTISKSRSEDNI